MATTHDKSRLTTEALETRWSAICERLSPHAASLMDQGALSSRLANGQRVWSVRFYVDEGEPSRKRQKAIYVGSHPELLRRVQQFLDHCREQGELFRAVQSCERLAAVACRAAGRFSNSPD